MLDGSEKRMGNWSALIYIKVSELVNQLQENILEKLIQMI